MSSPSNAYPSKKNKINVYTIFENIYKKQVCCEFSQQYISGFTMWILYKTSQRSKDTMFQYRHWEWICPFAVQTDPSVEHEPCIWL